VIRRIQRTCHPVTAGLPDFKDRHRGHGSAHRPAVLDFLPNLSRRPDA
jgi:hypothetical protein